MRLFLRNQLQAGSCLRFCGFRRKDEKRATMNLKPAESPRIFAPLARAHAWGMGWLIWASTTLVTRGAWHFDLGHICMIPTRPNAFGSRSDLRLFQIGNVVTKLAWKHQQKKIWFLKRYLRGQLFAKLEPTLPLAHFTCQGPFSVWSNASFGRTLFGTQLDEIWLFVHV